jgi:hypothetical protein
LPGAAVYVDKTNKERHFANLAMECFQRRAVEWDEAGFENQILWRVTSDREFRGEDELGPLPDQIAIRLDDPAVISREIADRGVELSESNSHVRATLSPRKLTHFFRRSRFIHVLPSFVRFIESPLDDVTHDPKQTRGGESGNDRH